MSLYDAGAFYPALATAFSGITPASGAEKASEGVLL